jgi:hypothetical protein
MMGGYEAILARQLEDQRLHYEMLLAKETREALERKQQSVYSAVGGRGRGGGGVGLDTNPTHQPQPQPQPQQQQLSLPLPSLEIDGSESEDFFALKLGYATTSPEDLERMEGLKEKISLLELTCADLTAETVEAEQRHAIVKRENLALLRQQKGLQDRAASLDARRAEVLARGVMERGSLLDQVRDLEFYMRSQEQMSRSGVASSDIQCSNIIITEGLGQDGSESSSRSHSPDKKGGRRGSRDSRGGKR